MKSDFWLFTEPPPLSPEAAHELLDFLHRIIAAVEQHYLHAPVHSSTSLEPDQPDLFEDLDETYPPF